MVVIAVAGPIGFSVGDYLLYSERNFDSERWRNTGLRGRARMEQDLRRSGILIGASRREVIELLGPPDGELCGNLQYDFVRGSLLGDSFGLPFSNWRVWLSVEFDSTGAVARLLVQD